MAGTHINRAIKQNNLEKIKQLMLDMDLAELRNTACKTIARCRPEAFNIVFEYSLKQRHKIVYYDTFLYQVLLEAASYNKLYVLEKAVKEDLNFKHIDFNDIIQYSNKAPRIVKFILDNFSNIYDNTKYNLITELLHCSHIDSYKVSYPKTIKVIMESFRFDFYYYSKFLEQKTISYPNPSWVNNLISFFKSYDQEKIFFNNPELFLPYFSDVDKEYYKQVILKKKVLEF